MAGDNATVTIAVAALGAVGAAFSAWLYSRHGGAPPMPESGLPPYQRWRLREGVVVDIPPDPLDIETVERLLKRIRRLERRWRHAAPILHKMANMLDWDDPEAYRPFNEDEDEDDL